MGNVLLCTHDAMLLKGLEYPLREAGHSVDSASGAVQALRMFFDRTFDLVLLDADVMGMSASEAVSVLRQVAPETRTIIKGDVPSCGGIGTLPSGSSLEELREAILQAVQPATRRREGDET
jgi:DNA-binding NtrC family response regulator